MVINQTAEINNTIDVRAKANGSGAKRMVMSYAAAVVCLLLLHAFEDGLDAAGATAVVALAAGRSSALPHSYTCS